MKDFKDISERVLFWLENKPETRDNDNMLLALIWWDDLKKMYGDPNNCGVKKFMAHMKDGHLSSLESCTRSRRKIQSENKYAHLRGKKWKERHTKGVDQAKHDIKDFKTRPANTLF